MPPILNVKDLSMYYHTPIGETKAIDHLSFTIEKGEFISIVGPSGCGKSTLLSLISGLLKPTSGKITLNKSLLHNKENPIGYMFQKDHLFEWRSILSNVKLGLEIQNKIDEENINYIEELLRSYDLYDFRHHYPSQLSGGMRQRAALIRTLALKPEILLLDEPFSALDYQTRLNLSDEVWSILKKENKTAILVTHDIAEAISMANKVIILSDRPATIKKVVDIEFQTDTPSPLNFRGIHIFQEYFQMVWKELNDSGK